jgi:hypothetical protein
MNYRIIIHALILLFILHIIIINTKYTITIGKNVENFRNTFVPHEKKNNNNHEKKNVEKMENNSLDFLGNTEKDNEFIQKMNLFSQEKNTESNFDKKNEFPVIPANGILNNENVPNFESNVANTPKFYNINNSYDNLDETELKSTSIQDLNKEGTTVLEKEINIDNQVRQSNVRPDNWEYNNEFAMNGGTMGGIVGFDGLESQFADFGSLLNMKKDSNEKNEDNIPHDDLRKPVVYYP